jgi:hypothetical protein
LEESWKYTREGISMYECAPSDSEEKPRVEQFNTSIAWKNPLAGETHVDSSLGIVTAVKRGVVK